MHMIFWGDKPFARLCLVLICGIVTAKYITCYTTILYYISFTLLLAVLLSTFLTSRYRDYYTGFLLLLFVGIGGYTRYTMVHPNMDKTHYSHYKSKDQVLISAEIKSIPKKTTRYSCFIKVNAIGSHPDSLYAVTGKMAAYFNLKDSIACHYRPGDEILVHGSISALRHSTNPFAFDFNDYLKTKHIHHRLDINIGSHRSTKQNLASAIEKAANSIRSKAIGTFDKYLEEQNHRSLAKAMVLGFRNTIDPSLYKSYTSTGAVHVLAVSGLHVGILCQIILLILNRLFKSSNIEKLLKLSFLSLTVFIYVIITGASAAVMRASVMVIIYYIGKYWAERVNKYNVLSLAAFLLLIYDPYMLFQASFQFSFLAILSIMLFYNSVYEWLFTYVELRSRIINYIWQMIALSIAAQILVAPLTIYYFHKFPLYFWLSGMVAVPAAYAVLVFGILMIIMEYLAPCLNLIIDYILSGIFKIFISSIQTIERFPYATFENLWLYTHELVILYLSLIFFLVGQHAIKAKYIILSLTLFLLFVGSRNYHSNQRVNQSHITVYENYKGHIIDIFDGDMCYNLKSTSIKERNIEFITTNNRINKQVKSVIDLNDKEIYLNNSFIKNKSLIQFKEESILLLDNTFNPPDSILPINTVIILGSHKINIDTIQKYINAERWIITQSESMYRQRKWLNWCSKTGNECIAINKTGAYSIDIK